MATELEYKRKATHQIVGHGIDVCGNFLPPPFESHDVSLTSQDTFHTDIPRHSLELIAETVESVHHVVDGIFEDEYFATGLDVNLTAHIAVRNSLRDAGDTADLWEISRLSHKRHGGTIGPHGKHT